MPKRKAKTKSEGSVSNKIERIEELRNMREKTEDERQELARLEGEVEESNDQR